MQPGESCTAGCKFPFVGRSNNTASCPVPWHGDVALMLEMKAEPIKLQARNFDADCYLRLIQSKHCIVTPQAPFSEPFHVGRTKLVRRHLETGTPFCQWVCPLKRPLPLLASSRGPRSRIAYGESTRTPCVAYCWCRRVFCSRSDVGPFLRVLERERPRFSQVAYSSSSKQRTGFTLVSTKQPDREGRRVVPSRCFCSSLEQWACLYRPPVLIQFCFLGVAIRSYFVGDQVIVQII